MKFNFLRNILVGTAIFAVSTSFSFSQTKIEKLTSKDNEKKAAALPAASNNSPRPKGSLNIHSLGVGLGQTFLNGDFDDSGEDKITFDILYNYSASHSFDLLIDLHSHKHSFKGRYVRLTGLAAGIKAKLYNFDNFSPFVTTGLGFYAPKVKRLINNAFIESESKVVFGFHLGAGGELRLNDKFTVGLLGQYHNPFDIKQELAPDVEGSYFKLLITGFFHF